MQLAKSMLLSSLRLRALSILTVGIFGISSLHAQDNSPYSRFGIGNLMPTTNVSTRAMGNISAGYYDYMGINWQNPATYAAFPVATEKRTNRVESGRAILDVGINISNRTLIAPNTPQRFTSSDLLFSYVQIGVPLRKNWGLSFGLRPISRINYRINRREMLKDPITGENIDSAVTQFRGEGGSYLPTIGTGFGFNISNRDNNSFRKTSHLRLGTNLGYLFGNRETKTLRNLIDTTDVYLASDHTVNTFFGDLFLNAGMQYEFVNDNKTNGKSTTFRIGISGNWKHDLKGTQDRMVQTYVEGSSGEPLQIDSVFEQKDIEGSLIFPANYRAGFYVQRINKNLSGWSFGVDYSQSKWSQYRLFGLRDSVQDNWELNVGASFNGKPGNSYFSNVVYRLGFFTGPDYITAGGELPRLGVTAGLGLPLRNYNRLTRQSTMINLAFEYGKRGNDDNVLKENLFRLSVGFNFNDIWFVKRKYD